MDMGSCPEATKDGSFQIFDAGLDEVTSQWLNRPMISGEGVYFLRELLCNSGMSEAQAASYSTHTP